MFVQNITAHTEFLDSVRAAREARQKASYEKEILTRFQAYARGYIVRATINKNVRTDFDNQFNSFAEFNKSQRLQDVVATFPIVKNFIRFFNREVDQQRFQCLCRYLLISNDNEEITKNFASLVINDNDAPSWKRVMKAVLIQCCDYLKDLRPEMPSDVKTIILYLHVLISYTACAKWAIFKNSEDVQCKATLQQTCSEVLAGLCDKDLFESISVLLTKGLCRNKPVLKATPLSAAFNLIMRPIIGRNFEEDLLGKFVLHVLAIPGLVLHLNNIAAECCQALLSHQMFTRCLEWLNNHKFSRVLFERMDGNGSLFILANLTYLGFLDKDVLLSNLLDYTHMATNLLEHCGSFSAGKQTNMSHWHPVLGWYTQSIESGYHESMPFVAEQLKILWRGASVKFLFADLAKSTENEFPPNQNIFSSKSGNIKRLNIFGKNVATVPKFLNKVFDQKLSTDSASSTGHQTLQRLGSAEATMLALVCTLYQKMIVTLKQLKYDILSGLCYQDFLLPRLWRYISSLGPQNGLKAFLDLLAHNPKATGPEFNILSLFADCTTYLIVILDDVELYEQNKPFDLETLRCVAQFCNWFIYKSIADSLIDIKSAETHPLFNSVLGLLSLLYNRDSRRSFCVSPDFWLIRDIKPSHFLNDLEKNNKKFELLIEKAPHILPHKERVMLFRKYVNADKDSLGIQPLLIQSHEFFDRPATPITVHRSRLVEDGYRQLSLLSVKAIKGVIRVKFVNEQGLEEPGIDQDGVFKEFLEETIKKVFDPSLNLFKTTSELRLYPSPTSHVHENHLALFDFVGRMLGKAVYEGIVVDIPFAFFVLNHIFGRVNSRVYSSIDVLPSLDPELYRSLTYVKHYEGDARDLDLTFSVDEDCMGQMVNYELVPGGKAVSVTNENKISYVHLMAHFRLYVQIKDQLNAFVHGFRSVINPKWLCLFSAPELQKLISGDTDVSMKDLKQHVQYYGGFHGGHRVILWLWDVLENDFNAEERRLFLKFVTSCSKPPLLGFAYLVPPFSIRCVEVAEDQDEGDTLGSVIRGFLAIRKKDPVGRLPTASTCFNLLKLPNYQKKSTLRDKLRYAIRAGSGFELS